MEETIFTQVLGNSPVVRVLGLLITGRELDYSISDIAEGSGVGWTTLHYVLPQLEKLNLIKKTREVGRAKMYQIHSEGKVTQQLILLYDNLLSISIDELTVKKDLYEGKEEVLLGLS